LEIGPFGKTVKPIQPLLEAKASEPKGQGKPGRKKGTMENVRFLPVRNCLIHTGVFHDNIRLLSPSQNKVLENCFLNYENFPDFPATLVSFLSTKCSPL